MLRSIITKLNHFWNNPDNRTRSVNRNVAYSMILKGAGIFVTLLLVPMTLGYISNYEYGIWITLNSILTWINYFDIGLGNGLRNKLAEAVAKDDWALGRKYVSTTLFLLFVIAGLLCITVLILNNFIDWYKILNVNDSVADLSKIINVVLICLCINFAIKTIGIVYMSLQKIWINNLLVFLGSFVSLIWIFILTKTSSASLFKVALAFSLSPILVYVVAYPITFYYKYKELRPHWKKIDLKYTKDLGGLGIQFFILQLAVLLIFSTSNFIISNVFSPAEVTPYTISYKYFNVIAVIFNIIIYSIWSAITDAYVRKDVNWIEFNIRKLVKLWGLCSGLFLLMVAISKPMYYIWVGDKVNISYGLSLSLAVFNIIFLWTNIFSAYCNGVGRLKVSLWTMSTAGILFIPMAIFVAKQIGIIGIGYSMGFVLLIPGIALYIQYRHDINKLKKGLL